jgi:hypothetical protein
MKTLIVLLAVVLSMIVPTSSAKDKPPAPEKTMKPAKSPVQDPP